jgi:hypothetical protein
MAHSSATFEHIIYAQAIALALALKLQGFSIRATGIQNDGHTDACLALASLRDRTLSPDQAAVNPMAERGIDPRPTRNDTSRTAPLYCRAIYGGVT